jgi:outer membrane lipoprotein-sorting protein
VSLQGVGGATRWVALATALCAGCAATRPLTPHPAPAVLPSAAQLETTLALRRDGVRSLRALAHLRFRDGDDSNSSREAIIVARPDRLRVEVLSLFGSVFVLTADGGTLTAYARQEGTVYQGQTSPENLWRYARIGLPVTDLVDLLLGTPPARSDRHAQVAFEPSSGWIRLRQDIDDRSQVVWFSEAELPVAAEERRDNDAPLWHATFGDYEDHGGLAIATRIGVDMPAARRSVEVAFDDIDLNPTLDHSIFAFQTPPGSKVVYLDRVAD